MYILLYYAFILFVDSETQLVVFIRNVFSTMGALISTLLLYHAYKRTALKEKKLWFYLAIGSASYFVAELFWMYYESYLRIDVPFPGIPDLFYMLQIFFYLVALLSYFIRFKSITKNMQFMFELLILMVVTVTLSYYFIIEKLITDPELTGLFLFVYLGYPFGDIALVFTALLLLFGKREIRYKKSLSIILLAVLIQAVADSGYFYLLLTDQYETGSLFDPLFTLALLMVGYSSLHARNEEISAASPVTVSMNVFTFILPYISCVGLILFIILFDREHTILTIGGFLSFVLIVVRQMIVLLSNQQLVADLNDSKQRFQSLFENHPDAVYSVTLEGEFIQVNQTAARLAKMTPEQFIGQSFYSFVQIKDRDKVSHYFQKARAGEHQQFELSSVNEEGDCFEFSVTMIPTYVERKVVGVFQIVKDVTMLKRSEEKTQYLAYHDSLTGLSNRAFFEESLQQELVTLKKKDSGLAVCLIDLDRFKLINDTLGHDAGDELLVEIADRLRSHVKEGDVVSRLGGDEFTVLLKNINRLQDVINIVESVMGDLGRSYLIRGHEFFTSPSIGISYCTEGDVTPVDMLKQADLAMYESKRNGKNQFTIYEKGMEQVSADQLVIENDLRRALEKNEFVLHYQPQFNTLNQQLYGVEALIRWQHPRLGLVAPGQFMAVAEESSIILPIGEWVVREACRQGKTWHDKGMIVTMSVNLSPKQFQSPCLVELLSEILEETQFDPNYLVLEITEAVAMNHIEKTIDTLTQIRSLGVQISIDDFGTGHSSLAYLAKLPIDALKIPREFVNELGVETNKAIVHTIITLASNLKLGLVAEGVETTSQKNLLQTMGCYKMQGYLLGKPATVEELENEWAVCGPRGQVP